MLRCLKIAKIPQKTFNIKQFGTNNDIVSFKRRALSF